MDVPMARAVTPSHEDDCAPIAEVAARQDVEDEGREAHDNEAIRIQALVDMYHPKLKYICEYLASNPMETSFEIKWHDPDISARMVLPGILETLSTSEFEFILGRQVRPCRWVIQRKLVYRRRG